MTLNLDLKAIVVDDDPVAQEQLIGLLEKIPDVEVLASFQDPVKALNYVKTNDFDIIFLDVEMPELNGMEFIQNIEEFSNQVIFYTSNPDYAVDSYYYNAIDFIVKPTTYKRLLKCIQRAQECKRKVLQSIKVNTENVKSIFIKADSRYVKLDFDEILYVEASGDYVVFKTEKKAYIVHSTMKKINENLPVSDFIKVHRSYIINKNKVVDIEDMSVVIGKKVIPISRSQKDVLMGSINLLK